MGTDQLSNSTVLFTLIVIMDEADVRVTFSMNIFLFYRQEKLSPPALFVFFLFI
jgi:hypothetical protein